MILFRPQGNTISAATSLAWWETHHSAVAIPERSAAPTTM